MRMSLSFLSISLFKTTWNVAHIFFINRYWHIARALQMASQDPAEAYDNYNDATRYRKTGKFFHVPFSLDESDLRLCVLVCVCVCECECAKQVS